jgi:hypothetical protein
MVGVIRNSSCFSSVYTLCSRQCSGNSSFCAQNNRAIIITSVIVLITLNVIFRDFFASDFFNRLLQYWGYGQCRPYVMPRKEYSFKPEEGPGLKWEGDREFWKNFPCARDSYRIVLPDGAAEAGDIFGAPSTRAKTDKPTSSTPIETCRSTVVSAMFDIGREKWSTYSRSMADYLGNANIVTSMTNKMVIFTSPDLVDHFVSERRSHGLMDRTMVVGMDVYCIPYAWLLEPVTRIMCSTEFTKGAAYLEIPERQQPFYNIIMYAKTLFLQAAATLPFNAVNSSYYTWLDLGCHGPMCTENSRNQCMDPSPWTREDRIRIGMTTPMSQNLWALDDVTWAKKHPVVFAGTIFGTSKKGAAQLADTFWDALSTLMAQGYLCYDQSIFALAFRRFPERFDLFHVFFDQWDKLVTVYSQKTVLPGQVDSEWKKKTFSSQG